MRGKHRIAKLISGADTARRRAERLWRGRQGATRGPRVPPGRIPRHRCRRLCSVRRGGPRPGALPAARVRACRPRLATGVAFLGSAPSGEAAPATRDVGTPAAGPGTPRRRQGRRAPPRAGGRRGKRTSLLHLPLNKKSSKCLINSLGRNKNIMRKTIWLKKKMALAGSLLLAVLVHMCLAEVVIRALANGLFTCFYIAPLYVLVILNLAAKRSSSEICVKP